MRVAVAPPFHGSHSGWLGCVLVLSWSAVACTGSIGSSTNQHPEMGAGASTPSTAGGSTGPAGMTGGGAVKPVAASADVGRVAIHRLNNTEYDNTIRDLLGVTASARAGFIPDEEAQGFNNIASAFGVTAAQFEQYYNSAQALADKAFADTAARARIVTCAPASATDQTCLKDIVKAFGLRAFRRPLPPTEIDALAKLGVDAIAQGEDFAGGVKHVVRTMLTSAHFLYRMEMDPEPTSPAPRKLTGFELASRLSYLHWSSMPDDQLFALAANNELLKDDVLSAQIDRMLGDVRGAEFAANFGGQWLGLQTFQNHQVEGTVFPTFDEGLRESMLKEGLMYFGEFLTGGRPMTEFFTADINFVDAKLGAFYGIAGGDAQMKKVSNTSDQRVGFLGLGNYLTQTSFAYRTAPTLRGHWVLENLLCTHVPPPPAGVPDLDSAATPAAMTQAQNVRERLAAHRADPTCAGCHAVLDPIGLGLENFDAIGRYRTQYPNGDAIDASGEMPDGTKFNGLPALAALLGRSSDSRIIDCSVEKMMTYALSRELVPADKTFVDQVRDSWKRKGMSLHNLLETVVLNDTFRSRRGEPN